MVYNRYLFGKKKISGKRKGKGKGYYEYIIMNKADNNDIFPSHHRHHFIKIWKHQLSRNHLLHAQFHPNFHIQLLQLGQFSPKPVEQYDRLV